jgi:hypothetical protein
MHYLNGYLVGGLVANAVVSSVVALGHPDMPVLPYIFLPILALGLLGLLLIASGSRRIGARIFLVASVVFVPLGMIGIAGARRVLDQLEQESLELRRARGAC